MRQVPADSTLAEFQDIPGKIIRKLPVQKADQPPVKSGLSSM